MKVLFKHLICWLLWFSVSTSSSLIYWNTTPAYSYFFNMAALIILFYTMYFLATSYYKKFSLADGLSKSKWAKWSYFLFNWEIAAMFLVTVVYIAGSFAMDSYFYATGHFEHSITSDVLYYIDGRFARGSLYIATGIAYGMAKMALRHKNEIIAAQKALNIITMQENALMKNTYSKRVKEMRNMVKSALADKEEE